MNVPERRRRTPYETHELHELATKALTQSYLVAGVGLVLQFVTELALRQWPDYADDSVRDAAVRYLGGGACAFLALLVSRWVPARRRHPFVEGYVLMVAVTALLAWSGHHTGGAQGPYAVSVCTLLFCWSLIMPGGARYAAFPILGALVTFYSGLYLAGGRGFFHVRTTAFALFTVSSAGFALVYAEVLERWRVRVSLAVSTDPLTQLLSRAHVLTRLEAALRGDALRAPVGVLMVDIDHFKRVNDTYGHAVGDEVLARVADTLTRSTRAEDACGRLGGEEFVVVLVDSSLESALQVSERIRANVAALRFASADAGVQEPFGVTVSLGVAVLPPDQGATVESSLRAADRALYESKSGGRDRVTLAE